MSDKELEIAYLKAKYESYGVDTKDIDWDLAIEYEKSRLVSSHLDDLDA